MAYRHGVKAGFMALSIEDLHPETEHFHAIESINQHAFPEGQRVPLEVFLPLAEQQIKRKTFYLRNGFHETGHQQQIHGNLYEVLCSRETYSRRAILALMQAIEESDE